jgi:hypothetical protein
MSGVNAFASNARITGTVNVQAVQSYENLVASGLVPGTSFVRISGQGIADSTERTLRGRATPQSYTFLSAPVTLEAVSDSVNDAAAGSGARTLSVNGLNSAGALQTTTVTLNGTTPVALTGSWLRVFRVQVLTQGTYGQVGGSNVGTILIRTASAGATHAAVQPQRGESQIASWTVPNGFTAHLQSYQVYVDGSKSANVRLYKREGVLTAVAPFSPWLRLQGYLGIVGGLDVSLSFPILFPAGTDIVWTAQNGASTSDVTLNCVLEIVAD